MALPRGSVHLLAVAPYWATQAGTSTPVMLGVSRMPMTGMPCASNCDQYAASPAPTSARAAEPTLGCAIVVMSAKLVVITTSGRTRETRSFSTLTPQAWHVGYAPLFTGS